MMRAGRQAPQHHLRAVIVESEAIDDGFVALQPENPRSWVAALRLRRHGTDFDKTEAQAQQRIRYFGVLVETGGHADRIGKIQTEGPNRQLFVVRPRPPGWQQFQPLDRQAMCILRIEPAQQRQRKSVECANHGSSSGMS